MLEHIPHGHASATSIPALSLATGLSDREVRSEIARLVNEEHVPVVTSPTPGGSVYLATTPEELDHVIRTARSRRHGEPETGAGVSVVPRGAELESYFVRTGGVM